MLFRVNVSVWKILIAKKSVGAYTADIMMNDSQKDFKSWSKPNLAIVSNWYKMVLVEAVTYGLVSKIISSSILSL